MAQSRNTSTNKGALTKDHLAALAQGRQEARVVREYLEALEEHRPKRGRKRTPESIQRRLDLVEKRLVEASGIDRVLLLQEHLNLVEAQATIEDDGDLQVYEDAFVEVAATYASRRGISYAAWREGGVSADVLRRAGITRAASAA